MNIATSISIMSFLPLSMVLVSAYAELPSTPYEVKVSPGNQQINLPDHAYVLRPDEFQEVRGQYDMSNGKVLTLSSGGRAIFAELDGFEKMELVAVTPNQYVAKNRHMKMVFDQYPNGNVTGVTLTYLDEHAPIAALKYVTLASK